MRKSRFALAVTFYAALLGHALAQGARPDFKSALSPLRDANAVALFSFSIMKMEKAELDLLSQVLATCLEGAPSAAAVDSCQQRTREFITKYADPSDERILNAVGAANAQSSPSSPFKIDHEYALATLRDFYLKVRPSIQARFKQL